MKSFKSYSRELLSEQLLSEGGNVVVTDTKGKAVPAEKIDLSVFDRSKFTKDMIEAFLKLNDMFEKEYGFPIWKNKKVLTSGLAFNGSAETFFTPQIPDEEFRKVKPKVGDIDLTVPDELKRQLWMLLNKLKGKKITPKVTYVGDNRPNYSPNNHQINAVVLYKDGKKVVNAQVDFELTPYEHAGSTPAEFTKFAHSSNWNDMKDNLKGVHHKYILRALVGGASVRDDIVVVTDKATPEKPRIRKMDGDPRMLKFSVDKGIRYAYKPQTLEDGSPWMIKGKQVYKEIPTKDSSFDQNLTNIFTLIFGEPQGKHDIQDMWSYKGILSLMKKNLNKKQVKATHDRLVNLYWSRGAQGFERNNPELDKLIKTTAYNVFLKVFPEFKKDSKVKKMMDEYYKNYRVTEIGV